jgi:hypothetical protein
MWHAMGEERNVSKVWWGKYEGVDGRMSSEWIFGRLAGGV